jgi:hypothetical protein
MATNAQAAIFHERAYERLLDEINSKDDLAVRLGDTLDVKASILLAAITLLATQTAYFLDKQTPGLPHYFLIGAVVLLVLATVATFVELWPTDYHLPVPETSGIDRVGEIYDHYSKYENADADVMISGFINDEIGWAQFRISRNEAINDKKSLWLQVSFYLTAGAMTLNLATLFMRLF